MCGIIFAKSLDGSPVNRIVVDQFEDQKSRGTEGFGLVLELPDKTLQVERSTETIKFLIDAHPKFNPSPMIMAHHRTPTSSPNYRSQTHPILVSNELLKYDYLIEHNGQIYNDDERRKDHLTMGFLYTTDIKYGQLDKFNDSESLAIDIALYIEQLTDKVEARGNAAYAGLQIDKVTKQPVNMFFGRNWSNPLHYSRDQKLIMLSSEGKGEMVEDGTITFIDLRSPKLKQKSYKLEIGTYQSNITPVRHYVGNAIGETGAEKIDSKSTTLVLTPAERIAQAEDEAAESAGYSRTDHFDNPAETLSEGTGAADDIDTPFAARIAEIETDLEQRLAYFMDCLTSALDIHEAGAMITDMVEAMNEALSEIQLEYENHQGEVSEAELTAQYERSMTQE
jgi:predicted glutamine amidotransferase